MVVYVGPSGLDFSRCYVSGWGLGALGDRGVLSLSRALHWFRALRFRVLGPALLQVGSKGLKYRSWSWEFQVQVSSRGLQDENFSFRLNSLEFTERIYGLSAPTTIFLMRAKPASRNPQRTRAPNNNIGALIITYILFWGSNYSIIYTKTLF